MQFAAHGGVGAARGRERNTHAVTPHHGRQISRQGSPLCRAKAEAPVAAAYQHRHQRARQMCQPGRPFRPRLRQQRRGHTMQRGAREHDIGALQPVMVVGNDQIEMCGRQAGIL